MARSVTYIPTTLIDRTIREKIVLVGVQFPGVTQDELDYQLEPHRAELTAYCYRMLASPFEAQDAVQDVTRPIPRRSSVRARSKNFVRSASRSTPTPLSSSTTSHRPSSATWRRSSGERRSTARP